MKSSGLFALLALAVMLNFFEAKQVSTDKDKKKKPKEAEIVGTPNPNLIQTTKKKPTSEEDNNTTPYPNHSQTTEKKPTTEEENDDTPYPNYLQTTKKEPTKRPAANCRRSCCRFKVSIDNAMVRDSDNAPFSSGSDVFVEVYANGLKIKETETISDNNNPRWSNQSFRVNVCEDTELKFDLYDYDVFPKTENDYLGSASMNYNDFVRGGGNAKKLPLQRAQDYLMVSFQME